MDGSNKAKTDVEREQLAARIKDWLKQAQTPFEDFVDPNISHEDIVLKVVGRRVDNTQPQAEYFMIFPSDADFLTISAYVHFRESDIGFKLLQHPHKVKFVNMLRIPLLTLNLSYTWIPSLHNFESLHVFKQIYFDGFSKNSYFDTVSAVMHGYEIALGRFEEFCNSISGSQGKDNNPPRW